MIHRGISLGNLFLGMKDDLAGFVGDLDLAKVDLDIIPGMVRRDRVKQTRSTPNGELSLSFVVRPFDVRMS